MNVAAKRGGAWSFLFGLMSVAVWAVWQRMGDRRSSAPGPEIGEWFVIAGIVFLLAGFAMTAGFAVAGLCGWSPRLTIAEKRALAEETGQLSR
jgi:hypothetical protein